LQDDLSCEVEIIPLIDNTFLEIAPDSFLVSSSKSFWKGAMDACQNASHICQLAYAESERRQGLMISQLRVKAKK
jgi:hypothetical protein